MPFQQFVTGPPPATAGYRNVSPHLPQASHIASWTVRWGDGTTDVLRATDAGDARLSTGGTFSIAATATTATWGPRTSHATWLLADGAAATGG